MKVTIFRPGKKGVFYAKYRLANGKYKKRSLGTTDSALARKIKDEMESQLLKQQYGIKRDVDFLPTDAWAAYKRVATRDEEPLKMQERVWLDFFEHSKAPTLRSVVRADVTAWVKELAKTRAATTVDKYVVECSGVYSRLISEELYDGPNPFAGRKRTASGVKKIRTLDWSSVEEAITEERGNPEYFLLVLAALLGLRKGEMAEARWEDIDWDAGRVLVRGTKTELSGSSLPLHPSLRAYLEPYRQPSGWILWPEVCHNGRYRVNLHYKWDELRQKYGWHHARLHDLRHTFATRLLDLGYKMGDIAYMMRHTSTRMAEHYADLRAVRVVIGEMTTPATG